MTSTRPAYPPAARLDLVEDLHGHQVADPYRWLEDADTPETKTWSAAQDALCRDTLDAFAGRDHLRRRLRDLMPGSISSPALRGDRRYFMRRQPGQDHGVLFIREPDGSERALVDPNAIDPGGTTTLDSSSLSHDGALLAYQLSQGGTERSALRVLDVDSGDHIEGPIDRTRYSPIAWEPDGRAYYYVRQLPPGAVPEGEEDMHRRVYRHVVGTDPDAADTLVFGDGGDKTAYYGVSLSLDGRWLMVTRALGTAPRNDMWIRDLHAANADWVVVQEGIDAETVGAVLADGLLYLRTNLEAPRQRYVVTDPVSPTSEHWRELLPEGDTVLEGVAVTDAHLIAVRTRHAVTELSVHDRATGDLVRNLDLPGLGVAGVSSRPGGTGNEIWVGYADFATPGRVLHATLPDGELELEADPPGVHPVEGVTATLESCRSADGTEIRLFVIRGTDRAVDAPCPTILYGYGGFNVPMTPAYSTAIVEWVSNGGVYAYAQLRGGSEEGEEWHRAGMREHKQNVFDDYIACAEWLISSGVTDADHLAISGGSNGGLLVGAALTQRPDLFRAVVCSAPLLDMVRYERWGLGVTWNDEYGTAGNSTELEWLLGYSPYHRVRDAVPYPAVLFTTFEGDTRVDPLHARKLCAALQHATTSGSDRPILLRSEPDVGHAGRSLSRTIELAVDQYAFLAHQLGLAFPAAVLT